MITLLAVTLVIAIVIRIPLAFSLGFSCLIVLWATGDVSMLIIPQRIFAGIDSFSLLAIPFFLLAGNLMTASGITHRILDFANTIVGRFHGGLAISNIIASIFFGGISGSAVADTAAVGGVLIPAMIKEGYGRGFSVAVTASSSVVAPIIPPSIVFIVYGVLTGQSITRLFLAGAIPGILYGLILIGLAYYISKKRNYPKHPPAGLREIWTSFKRSALALFMPVFILGGIVSGVFTVTECSAIAVVYALVVGLFIYRKLRIRDLIPIIRDSSRTSALIMLIVGMAKLFSWVLVNDRVPQVIAAGIMEFTSNPLLVLLLINVVLLFIGTFMEANAALVMLIPVLFPLTQAAGIDPIHFGVVASMNICLGLITPPVGLCLNLSCEIAETPLEKGASSIMPFFLVGLISLIIVSIFSQLSLFLPGLIMP